MTEELQAIGKPYTGLAFRVDIPNWGIPRNATAADVARFEMKELGNEYDISKETMDILDKYHHDDIVWVTKKKKEAKEYLSKGMTARDVTKVDLPPGSRIIAKDDEGGYLILRGDAVPMSSRAEIDLGDVDKEPSPTLTKEADGEQYEWQYGAEPLAAIPGEPMGYYCSVRGGSLEGEAFEGAKAFLYETDDGKYYIKLKDGTLVYNPMSKSALFNDAESAKERFKMYTGEVKPGDHVVLQGIKDTYEGRVVSVQDDTIRIVTPQWERMQWNKSAIKEVIPGEKEELSEPKMHKRKQSKHSLPAGGYLE